MFTHVTNVDLSKWSEWITWNGGECPIPWAKAGQYRAAMRNHLVADGSHIIDAVKNVWQHGHNRFGENIDIIAYRYDKSANPEM